MQFIPVLGGATAPDEFPALALVLTVRESVEVDVGGAAAVPAHEALAHAVLTSMDVVEERRSK